jgi:hypothetical protein
VVVAKVVPDDQNRFRKTWNMAREQGVSRQVMADSLGIDRGRLNDLILGRARPRLAEAGSLSGRRRATLVRYHDETGARHSFYTGRGMSYERLIETEAIMELADEMSDREHYADFDHVIGMENRYPSRPVETRIYSTNRTLREQLG